MSAPGFRAVRAALFAAVCVGMALCGHVAAGGAAPQLAVVLLAAGALTLLAFPAAGGQRSVRSLTLGLLTAQLLLHTLFWVAAPAPAPGSPEQVARLAGPMCGGGVVDPGDAVMGVAHLWAALATGWWLAWGEEGLWTVLRWLRAALALPPHTTGAGVPGGPRPSTPPPATGLRLSRLRHAIAERAPPRARAGSPCAPARTRVALTCSPAA
ncbi:hypothetical protein [Haloactinospora alba]|nr:hypothetical protein [Haloactinospora alba]